MTIIWALLQICVNALIKFVLPLLCNNNCRRSPCCIHQIRVLLFEPSSHCTRIASTCYNPFSLVLLFKVSDELSCIFQGLFNSQIFQIFGWPTSSIVGKGLRLAIISMLKLYQYGTYLLPVWKWSPVIRIFSTVWTFTAKVENNWCIRIILLHILIIRKVSIIKR